MFPLSLPILPIPSLMQSMLGTTVEYRCPVSVNANKKYIVEHAFKKISILSIYLD